MVDVAQARSCVNVTVILERSPFRFCSVSVWLAAFLATAMCTGMWLCVPTLRAGWTQVIFPVSSSSCFMLKP